MKNWNRKMMEREDFLSDLSCYKKSKYMIEHVKKVVICSKVLKLSVKKQQNLVKNASE